MWELQLGGPNTLCQRVAGEALEGAACAHRRTLLPARRLAWERW